jgi:hypothetical protein
MQAFITQTAQDFGVSRSAVQALTAASLWLMQLNAPDAFARGHQSDPLIRVLVDSAPAALAQVPTGLSRRTDHVLLRLFSQHGFSLHLACRFTQRLFDALARAVGGPTMVAIQHQCDTLDLLLLERRLSQAPRRIPTASLAPTPAMGRMA